MNLFGALYLGYGTIIHSTKHTRQQMKHKSYLAKKRREITTILPMVRHSRRNDLTEVALRQQMATNARPLQMIEFQYVKPKESRCLKSLFPTFVKSRRKGQEKMTNELTIKYQLVKNYNPGVFENFIYQLSIKHHQYSHLHQLQPFLSQLSIPTILILFPPYQSCYQPYIQNQVFFNKTQLISIPMYSDEAKLVEALKSFMNRTVVPILPQNHHSLNEWKFLSGIISSNPVDHSQLDFYIMMVNKNSPSQSQQAPRTYYGSGDNNSPSKSQANSENNNKKSGFGVSNSRKTLLASMQNIHNQMIKNQQRLEGYTKKDSNTSQMNTSNNSIALGSRKFI